MKNEIENQSAPNIGGYLQNVKGMARREGAQIDQTASSASPSPPCSDSSFIRDCTSPTPEIPDQQCPSRHDPTIPSEETPLRYSLNNPETGTSEWGESQSWNLWWGAEIAPKPECVLSRLEYVKVTALLHCIAGLFPSLTIQELTDQLRLYARDNNHATNSLHLLLENRLFSDERINRLSPWYLQFGIEDTIQKAMRDSFESVLSLMGFAGDFSFIPNVKGMARRGQATNLIRRLPRRRHLRLVRFLELFPLVAIWIIVVVLGWIVIVKILASRKVDSVDHTPDLSQGSSESAPSQYKNSERDLSVLCIKNGDCLLKLVDSSRHLNMIDGKRPDNSLRSVLLTVEVVGSQCTKQPLQFVWVGTKDLLASESGVQRILGSDVLGFFHFLANVKGMATRGSEPARSPEEAEPSQEFEQTASSGSPSPPCSDSSFELWRRRMMRKSLDWLLVRCPVRLTCMGNPKELRVVILLDMGVDDSWMRRITVPVDLSEYPDAHQARSLAVRLEMVGHEGSDHAMRTVEMHGGLGSSLIDGQCSDAQKTYQRMLPLLNGLCRSGLSTQ